MSRPAKDPFDYRPKKNWDRERVEDGACRRALKTAGLNPAKVMRDAGLDPRGLLTFAVLVDYADYPFNHAVTEQPFDDLLTLMTRLSKSRLAAAWFAAWAERPGVPAGGRSMVMRGAKTGYVLVYDSAVPPERPHLSLGFRRGLVLRVEPLSSWCVGVSWAVGPGHQPRQG